MQPMEEAKAPYVTFDKRPIEDREATIKNGQYTSRDEVYAFITPMGSRDRYEVQVDDWFRQMEQEVASKRMPEEWLRAFRGRYEAWKKGEELPVNGTPIKSWPVISPAQRKNLIDWHVLTVEQLAEANEDLVRRLGMGGRALKQQAVDWLASAKDTGKVTLEIGALRTQNEQLLASNNLMQEQIRELSSKLELLMPAGGTPNSASQAPSMSEGLLTDDRPQRQKL